LTERLGEQTVQASELHFFRKKTGEAVELDGWHTAIWEDHGGKWLIVHEHFSAPLS